MPTYDDQLRSANWYAKMIPTAYLGVETIIHGNVGNNGKQQRETASPRLVLLMIQTGAQSFMAANFDFRSSIATTVKWQPSKVRT